MENQKKITLISLNGQGRKCAEGRECNKQEICHPNHKTCSECGIGFEPDVTQSKCVGMFCDLFSTT